MSTWTTLNDVQRKNTTATDLLSRLCTGEVIKSNISLSFKKIATCYIEIKKKNYIDYDGTS